jgi:hypothetical protein
MMTFTYDGDAAAGAEVIISGTRLLSSSNDSDNNARTPHRTRAKIMMKQAMFAEDCF